MNISDTVTAIWDNKLNFFGSFFVVFTILYGILYVIDFLPEEPQPAVETIDTDTSASTETTEQTETQNELTPESIVAPEVSEPDMPVSIYVERLDRSVDVLNPQSRTIADLDAALLDGVVRHPDSVTPDRDGNVFILGHSSYLPNVFNKNFQAFNGIQDLQWGDTITLTSDDMVYTYRVEDVYRAKASDVTVPVAGDEKLLTIATCNSFGSTDDRYIVEAKQVSAVSIG